MFSHGIHIICKWVISSNEHIIISFRHDFIGSIRATVYNKIIIFKYLLASLQLNFTPYEEYRLC